MSYQTGSILSATPSNEVMTIIESMLTAHPAWEFVENYVDGTYTNRVWKCLGTENGFGQDFYVAFMRLTASIGTAQIIVQVAEQYNATTHVATRALANPGSTFTVDATYAAPYGNTGYAFSHANWYKSIPYTPTTSTFQYYFVVTPNSILMAGSSTTYPVFAGLYEPFWDGLDTIPDFPLCAIQMGYSDADGSGAFTRMPGAQGTSYTDTMAAYWYLGAVGSPANALLQTPHGSVGTNNPVSKQKLYGAEVCAMTGSGTFPPKGVFTDMLYFMGSGGRGDTLTVDGDTWVNVYPQLWMNTET